MKKEPTNWNTYLIVVVVIAVAVGLYFMLAMPTSKEAPKQKAPAKEVTLTILGADCKECFNISVAKDFIKQQKTISLKETKELTIDESKELAGKYNITKLPALIITGDITNLTISNFDSKEDALVFDKTPPPYYDIATEAIKGKVAITIIEDTNCKECFNISLIVAQMEQAGIIISSKTAVYAKGEDGKALIQKYNITKIPTIIMSKDALDYDVIAQAWEQVGTTESDGKLVLRMVNPPYINVSTGAVEGITTITYLVDEGCTECTNASGYKEILTQSFNMYFKTEETIGVNSTKGKLMVKKYGIELVPTVIISKEANAYPNFAEGWKSVGTEETDGSFVFKNVPLLKNYYAMQGKTFLYKNLTSGEVVNGTTEAEITPPAPE